MSRFWVWGVRNPCLLLGGLAAATGLNGVADQSIAFTVLLGFGLLAETATHLARRARAKERRARAADDAVRGAIEMRERFQHRKAA
ncbi:MAG: hypothetical protein ABI939_03535 [Anaerolineaceae bacterium]